MAVLLLSVSYYFWYKRKTIFRVIKFFFKSEKLAYHNVCYKADKEKIDIKLLIIIYEHFGFHIQKRGLTYTLFY